MRHENEAGNSHAEERDERRTKIPNRMDSKAKRLARRTTLAVGLGVVLALTLALTAGAAEAAKAKSLQAGVRNAVSAVTSMVGNVTGPVLKLDNNSTASGATALELQVEAGQAPLTVSPGAGVATGLNAENSKTSDVAGYAQASGKSSDADTLDGRNSSDFAPGSAEAWHEVGASGEPGFQSGFSNYRDQGTANWSTAAFYKDPYGVVHLKGTVKSRSDIIGGSPIFTLPSGYRPSAIERHVVFKNIGVFDEQVVFVDIQPYGSVTVGGGRYDHGLSLDGISFRAAN